MNCPECGSKMKFRGSRVHYCKKCKRLFQYARDATPSNDSSFDIDTTMIRNMFNPDRFA